MNQYPLLSVIVPVFNVEEFVSECIESITKQTYSNIEILIINDGSTDNSLSVISEYATKDSRIKIINKRNGGLSSARNCGLEASNGDLVTFIDSDDVLLNLDIYKDVIAEFHNDETLDIVQFDTIYRWRSKEAYRKQYPFRIYEDKKQMTEAFLLGNIHVSFCDKIFKASVIKDLRFPLKQQSEDIAMISFLIENVNRLKIINKGFYGYRYREGSITKSSLTIDKINQILKSEFSLIFYSYNKHDLKKITINRYVDLYWNYISCLGKYEKKNVYNILNQDLFLKINFLDYIKYSPSKFSLFGIKTLILGVGGPRLTYLFQRLYYNLKSLLSGIISNK